MLEVDRRDGPAILRRLRGRPPAAVVISLDRLPIQGRDVGIAIRTGKQTRPVPLLFVGGEANKVERVRRVLPDAAYTGWAGLIRDLKGAIARPPRNPVMPASNLAGYSGTPLPKKLGIKPNSYIALLQEPENFVELLGELPPGAHFTNRLDRRTALAIWFVRSAADLAAEVDSMARSLGRGRLWIAWAKRTSTLAGDVNEMVVRAAGLGAGLVDYKVAAIDADWSGLLFAPRRDGEAAQRRSEQRQAMSRAAARKR
ncbi:MAG TPA: hypothetical protein VL523_14970 [Terriglobia bacterium]|nr:hypothetical protein [Terriglobia bacterium]